MYCTYCTKRTFTLPSQVLALDRHVSDGVSVLLQVKGLKVCEQLSQGEERVNVRIYSLLISSPIRTT